ncbi:MAG: AAA family ATPase [Vitreimonas sp.]
MSDVSASRPSLWIVAGPNGVGKTTYAEVQIPQLSGATSFLNLDAIARGISPLDPNQDQLKAGRIAIGLMRESIDRGITFTIESTLSGKGHKGLIARAKSRDYLIKLLYFYVTDPDEALRRIARRVADGGHDVPRRDATRRFKRSLEQFGSYAELSDSWWIYDTDNPTARLRASGSAGALTSEENVPDALLPVELENWLAKRRPA